MTNKKISELSNEELMAELKRREQEQKTKDSTLPKTTQLCAYGDELINEQALYEDGFTQDQIDSFSLSRLLYEVIFTFRIEQDGKKILTHLNNRELKEPMEWR